MSLWYSYLNVLLEFQIVASGESDTDNSFMIPMIPLRLWVAVGNQVDKAPAEYGINSI
jgi:hypothetical protein